MYKNAAHEAGDKFNDEGNYCWEHQWRTPEIERENKKIRNKKLWSRLKLFTQFQPGKKN